jgi:uncharacterized protein DUF4115
MPSTYREKLIAAVGFGAVLVLVGLALIVGKGGERTSTTANPPPVTTAPQPAATPPPATTTDRQPQPGDAQLVVRATRGESPLSVHADSEDGVILYEGVLARGRTVRLFSARLWIRLGAAENVDLTLNGQPVERLPAGPLELIATPGQLQAAS